MLSFDVIEHLPAVSIMLKETRRLLKKGGVLILSTPNRGRIFSFILLKLGRRRFPYAPDAATAASDPYAWHLREYTEKELEDLLFQEGFKTVRRHRLFYGLSGGLGLSSFFNLPFYHNIILECRKIA